MVFTGFTPAAGRFFTELARNNSREWFTAHRAEYDALIRQPLEDLLGEATAQHGEGRIMRPNRDVRFSADKSPYRVNAGLWAGSVGGVYLQASAQGLEVGGGVYEPSRDQLQRAREAIDTRPTVATRLATIVEDLTDRGFEFAGPALTTAPRGFPRDHPHIALLRLRHYAALRHLPLTADADRIRSTWAEVTALNAWNAEYVGAALSWP